MFKAQYKRSFVVNKHHKQMFEALQDVVDGKCNRLIINMPPRYSKCMHPDTQVYTPQGLIAIKDLRPGDKVYSYENGHLVEALCQGTEPAYKESVKVTMRSGRSFICSTDHPMLTPFGYTRVGMLKKGDRLRALHAEVDNVYEINDAELLFTTLMIFEGNCRADNLRFACDSDFLINRIKEICAALSIKIKNYACCKSFEYNVMGGRDGKAANILRKYGILDHLAYTKRIPKSWFALSTRQKYLFLDMMFATDGWINTLTGQCGITLANKGLIDDIQQILASVNIISTISYRDNDKAGAWTISIPRQEGVKLLDKCSFYQKRASAITMLNKKAISLVDTFPFEIIRHEKLTYQTRKYGIRCQPHKNISREKFNRLAEFFPQLNKYIDKDFYYDTIESVENVGMQELVHLGVDRTHNFIANGLVSHNTEVVVKSFISWGFALNATCRFLHLSYSDMLVNDNSNTVRQIMMEPLYTTLFPNSALEKEKGSSNRWKTKAGGELYAVSTQGQVTGFGAGKVDEVDEDDSDPFIIGDEILNAMLNQIDAKKNIFQGAIIIDDPLKPEDALSDVTRERVNQRFENTIRNRVNSRNTPIIIIMQRLHEHDLCGYLMEKEPDKWRVLSLPALSVNEEGEEVALWPLKHTVEELHELRALDPLVFDTQYMQDPTPKEGLMYSEGFGTYKPEQLLDIIRGQKPISCNYTDTADTGADNLCSICFIDTPEYAYVTDVLFTDEPMEYTEPATARMLTRNKVKKARIESNNGGRGFARNVQRLLKTANHNYSTRVEWFSQTKNKFVRIFSYSAIVQNTVLFPEGWEKKWPKFHSALMGYRKDNRARTQHDDAPDCLTGVVEMKERSAKKTKIHRRN